MVIRFNTTCNGCGKENSVFGFNRVCSECRKRGFFKAQIKRAKVEKKMTAELRALKPEIRAKLHDELLKEILEEERLLEDGKK